MSSTPSNQLPNRRSQRQAIRKSTGAAKCDVGDSSLSAAQPTPVKKKRKKDLALDTDNLDAEASLEAVGVSVGKKTSRERLLGLLDKHINPKKPRLSRQKSRFPSKNEHRSGKHQKTLPVENELHVKKDVNYNIYHESQLVEMLQSIGVNTRGLDKEALVKSCKSHSDLQNVGATSTQSPNLYSGDIDSSMLEPGCSSSVLPSLENDFFDDSNTPQPSPTSLINSSGKRGSWKGKGKGKARAPDEGAHFSDDLENYPEGLDQDEQTQPPMSARGKSSSPEPTNQMGPDHRELSELDRLKAQVAEQNLTISRLENTVNETNTRVEGLETGLKAVCDIVDKLAGKCRDRAAEETSCGGRIASRMCFHVQTLLGQRDNEKKLPRAASEEEKEGWMSDQPLDSFNFNVDLNCLPSDAQGGFPYEDGPGNPKATSQQLSVMWQMMKKVSVKSFRPDFSTSASGKDNKWLWSLALKIFIKLVECGEYTGIPLGEEGIKVIKKTLNSHVQSLMKRFREENWDVSRKKRAADEVRQSTRLRHCLWPLSAIVQVACSDDETDEEDAAVGPSKPLKVRELRWRSSALELLCILIDNYKTSIDESIPGFSPGQKGRSPRTRIRTDHRPVSRIEAPVALPVDCYSEEWLSDLTPLARTQLEIHSTPVLQPFISTIKSYLAGSGSRPSS
ncbi:uncharacterized protein MELLADRAFT_58799 [Melampsora larici-populina 98AG31]|uniref:Uncharacterized protein n=1 Tax=Melampsora larici-populina (strain 98AG31 / pathotype 3-4-7) TaxID=747676 RepID=F4R4W9_MELLP|nr:uncharacterized protein MELLADRAFT_58799 [Melampsora larici-populina 98AG31]EGG12879.1 hypothetical protein MELLADRAFT_58799 [Melampsora larici-populina 98AG31]